MKKLHLKLQDLRVDTFETLPASTGPGGTVRARESTEPGCGTRDWGLCTDASEAAFGCGGGTEGCTLDPYNDLCYSYGQQCPMTVIPSWSCAGTCEGGGQTVCAGNCTEQCTT